MRTFVRFVITAIVLVAVVLALGAWAGMATLLMVFQCGDNCGVPGPQPNAWRYTVQGIVALAGAGAGVLALVLAFMHHRSAFAWRAGIAAFGLVAWWSLIESWRL